MLANAHGWQQQREGPPPTRRLRFFSAIAIVKQQDDNDNDNDHDKIWQSREVKSKKFLTFFPGGGQALSAEKMGPGNKIDVGRWAVKNDTLV